MNPVAHAYVVEGECEQIEWGTDVCLPDDPALVYLYTGEEIERLRAVLVKAEGDTDG